jgi:hypothetical protein
MVRGTIMNGQELRGKSCGQFEDTVSVLADGNRAVLLIQ